MATGFEHATQGRRVIDLPIAHHDDGAIFVPERLISAFEIIDAEAGHTHAESTVHEVSFVIGTSVRNGRTHPMERVTAHRRTVTVIELADYSAHV
jgi:hypothetical protein